MKHLFLLFFIFYLENLFSQNTISGQVKDIDGIPIEGVNIYLENTIDGATSNSEGYFSFEINETAEITLIASYIGHFNYSRTAYATDLQDIQITLYLDDTNLDEVIISTSTFSLGKSRTVAKMNSLDIVMTGSSNGDIFAALQTLPGAQKVGEDGRLYIRGGEDRETQIFIDGMHVLMPYTTSVQNSTVRSRFSPFLFKGINFSLGGYELEYGQALSAVLPMETKDVADGTKLGVNLSPLNVGGGGSYLTGKESISANIDYTNLGFYNSIFPDRIDWKKDYSKFSSELLYKMEIGQTSLFKIYTGYDHTNFVQNISDNNNIQGKRFFGLNQDNYYINSTYITKTKSEIDLFFGSAFSQIKNEYNNAIILGDLYIEDINELHLKTKLKNSFSPFYKINFGIEAYIQKYKNTYTDALHITRQNQFVASNIYASFLENQIKLLRGLYANVSGRMEYSSYNQEYTFSPRTSLDYVNGNLQISGILGKYYQSPENTIIAANAVSLKQESAIHYIIGSAYNFSNRLARVEIYHKDYNRLSLLKEDTYNSMGFGQSHGVDLYITDDQSFNQLNYTLSFSYNNSSRLYKNYPIESTPLFSTSVNTSLNIRYHLSSLKTYIGLTNIYASGRPYHNPNKPGFVNSKTSSFHSLDMNLTFLISEKIILYTSLTNVFGRKNTFGYKYADSRNENGFFSRNPINATRDRFFFIGLFISLKNNSAYDVSNF